MIEPRLYYLLDPMTHEVTSTDDIQFWAAMLEGSGRIVARTALDEVLVSTVFLGINHQFGDGPPLLFETMIFGGELNDSQSRYSTWDAAVLGHNSWVEAATIAHTPWRRLKAKAKYRIERLKRWWWLASGKIRRKFNDLRSGD